MFRPLVLEWDEKRKSCWIEGKVLFCQIKDDIVPVEILKVNYSTRYIDLQPIVCDVSTEYSAPQSVSQGVLAPYSCSISFDQIVLYQYFVETHRLPRCKETRLIEPIYPIDSYPGWRKDLNNSLGHIGNLPMVIAEIVLDYTFRDWNEVEVGDVVEVFCKIRLCWCEAVVEDICIQSTLKTLAISIRPLGFLSCNHFLITMDSPDLAPWQTHILNPRLLNVRREAIQSYFALQTKRARARRKRDKKRQNQKYNIFYKR